MVASKQSEQAVTVGIPDPDFFASEAERITNNALLDDLISVFHQDAVVEWITDGVVQRYEGIEEISQAAAVLVAVWSDQKLKVKKAVEASGPDAIVLSWTGAFRDGNHQIGTEFLTFADGKVIHQRLYTFLNVRPESSVFAKLHLLTTAPRVALSFLRNQRVDKQ